MEEALKINDDISIPGHELSFTASRSGGPGGQHVNKTSSKITLHWDITNTEAFEITARNRLIAKLRNRLNSEGVLNLIAEDERSQHRNRDIARERLKELILDALKETKPRIPTKASKASKKRRLDNKKRRSAIKQLRSTPDQDD